MLNWEVGNSGKGVNLSVEVWVEFCCCYIYIDCVGIKKIRFWL